MFASKISIHWSCLIKRALVHCSNCSPKLSPMFSLGDAIVHNHHLFQQCLLLNIVLGTKKDVALAYKLLTSTKVGVPHTFIHAFVLGSIVGFFLVNTHNLCPQSLIQKLVFLPCQILFNIYATMFIWRKEIWIPHISPCLYQLQKGMHSWKICLGLINAFEVLCLNPPPPPMSHCGLFSKIPSNHYFLMDRGCSLPNTYHIFPQWLIIYGNICGTMFLLQ
jgi:hypothetical protein